MKFINFDNYIEKNNNDFLNKNCFTPQHLSNTVILGIYRMFKSQFIIQYFKIKSCL